MASDQAPSDRGRTAASSRRPVETVAVEERWTEKYFVDPAREPYEAERKEAALVLEQLHMPFERMLDAELIDALLDVFSRNPDSQGGELAQRLATAVAWLAQSWRNTESIRMTERIVMLKTAFEALTDDSKTWRSAQSLVGLFGELRDSGVTDLGTSGLLWKPSETASLSWKEGSSTYPCTPLEHWFRSFGAARNDVIHKGRLLSSSYDVPESQYQGPYVFIGERLLREACRVALRQFGFDDLWKDVPTRVLTRLFHNWPVGQSGS